MDYEFGHNQERLLKPIIESVVGRVQTKNRYCAYDFENETCIVELKSRKVNHDAYPSLMIGLNKLKTFDKNSHKDAYVFFGFTDGVYYWNYNKQDVYNAVGGRTDRGKDERKLYGFIPRECLIKV